MDKSCKYRQTHISDNTFYFNANELYYFVFVEVFIFINLADDLFKVTYKLIIIIYKYLLNIVFHFITVAAFL